MMRGFNGYLINLETDVHPWAYVSHSDSSGDVPTKLKATQKARPTTDASMKTIYITGSL
jgi:hypothetical protein